MSAAEITLPKYTVQELRERVTESMHEIREGKGQPIDDFLEEVEKIKKR